MCILARVLIIGLQTTQPELDAFEVGRVLAEGSSPAKPNL
jgi:hypothetical protein